MEIVKIVREDNLPIKVDNFKEDYLGNIIKHYNYSYNYVYELKSGDIIARLDETINEYNKIVSLDLKQYNSYFNIKNDEINVDGMHSFKILRFKDLSKDYKKIIIKYSNDAVKL